MRFFGSCPLGGESSALSGAGWLSEIRVGGSKTEANWALVKGAASARRANKRYNGRKRPILTERERVERTCVRGGERSCATCVFCNWRRICGFSLQWPLVALQIILAGILSGPMNPACFAPPKGLDRDHTTDRDPADLRLNDDSWDERG